MLAFRLVDVLGNFVCTSHVITPSAPLDMWCETSIGDYSHERFLMRREPLPPTPPSTSVLKDIACVCGLKCPMCSFLTIPVSRLPKKLEVKLNVHTSQTINDPSNSTHQYLSTFSREPKYMHPWVLIIAPQLRRLTSCSKLTNIGRPNGPRSEI